jgi:hypothetical protein
MTKPIRKDDVFRIKRSPLIFPALLALILFLPRCGEVESSRGLTTVALSFSTQQANQSLDFLKDLLIDNNPYPSVITQMVIEVTYDDQGPRKIRREIPGKDVSSSMLAFVEVPPGDNRTFKIEAYNRGGGIIFSGEKSGVTLAPDKIVNDVQVDLAFSCHGTAWDAEKDTIPDLVSDIGESLLKFVDENLVNKLKALAKYDVLSLKIEKKTGGFSIAAEFVNELNPQEFFGAILLDTDRNSATPSSIGQLTELISEIGVTNLGADYLVVIKTGGSAWLISLSDFSGNLEDLPNVAGINISGGLSILDREVTIQIPENLTGDVTGTISFFGIFGVNYTPTDFIPDWGSCLSE